MKLSKDQRILLGFVAAFVTPYIIMLRIDYLLDRDFAMIFWVIGEIGLGFLASRYAQYLEFKDMP